MIDRLCDVNDVVIDVVPCMCEWCIAYDRLMMLGYVGCYFVGCHVIGVDDVMVWTVVLECACYMLVIG